MNNHAVVLSVDLEEWYHSRRWVDGEQSRGVPDATERFRRIYNSDCPAGEIIEPTLEVLALFERRKVKATFFVLGETATWYPDLVRRIADAGHEIASHGDVHVDMPVLGEQQFAERLERSVELLEKLTGARPVGYRAPNLVYEPWATRVLENHGFIYDSTVCASRPIGGKYKGWLNAPAHPYRPDYEAIGRPGSAQLVEVPLPSTRRLRLPAGSGIITRMCGFNWTRRALAHALGSGSTGFYFHPWEVGPRPKTSGHAIRNALFLRRTGPWMMRTVEALLEAFEGRISTARAVAERFLAEEKQRGQARANMHPFLAHPSHP